mgnify:CR=1 FL=1
MNSDKKLQFTIFLEFATLIIAFVGVFLGALFIFEGSLMIAFPVSIFLIVVMFYVRYMHRVWSVWSGHWVLSQPTLHRTFFEDKKRTAIAVSSIMEVAKERRPHKFQRCMRQGCLRMLLTSLTWACAHWMHRSRFVISYVFRRPGMSSSGVRRAAGVKRCRGRPPSQAQQREQGRGQHVKLGV